MYISYDGMTDTIPQSQVIPYLEGLSKLGYRFTLISCEKPDAYQEGGEVIHALCKKIGINWVPLMYHLKPPVLSTVYDVLHIRKVARDLDSKDPFDIIHCRSYISALVGLHLKRNRKRRFVFDMRGFWAEERVDGGLWNLSNPVYNTVYKFFKRQERSFFKESDYTVSLTYNAKEEIARLYDEDGFHVPVQVIPCCVDTSLFDAGKISDADKQTYRIKFGLDENTPAISYVGSIGTWYMLPEMLDFYVRLLKKKPDAKFLFITPSAPELIRKEAQKRGLSDDQILIYKAGRSEMPTLISLCSASVFFIKPAYSKKASSPTKQAEIMSLGIPLICNPGVGDTDKVVRDYHAGVVVASFDDSSYDKAIDEWIHTSFDSASIRKGAIEFYDLKTGVQRYDEVYRNVLAS